MPHIIAGLGNPGEEYKHTRHNVGRIVLEHVRKQNGFSDWREEGKRKALAAEGVIGKHKVLFIEPNNFMNNSGKSLVPLVTSAKKAEQLVVIYDDLDLPFGTFRIVFDRGSGGHKGIESIARNIKTKAFVRIRIGICPVTPAGKPRKPKGERKVLDFIMKDFSAAELKILKKLSASVARALFTIVTEGRQQAMNRFN